MNLATSYRSQLKSFNKRRFDPFCRRERIVFPLRDTRDVPSAPASIVRLDGIEARKPRGQSRGLSWPKEAALLGPVGEGVVHLVVTTVGQINFFRWCIANDVLTYAIKHKAEIDSDMLASARTRETRVQAKSAAAQARGASTGDARGARVVHCRMETFSLSFR
jgi:hypothetical protein